MNETIAALLKDGGIIAALVVILLIVRAIVPAFLRKNNHAKPPLMIDSQPPRIATSGEQSTDYWKNEIRLAVKIAIEEELKSRPRPLNAEETRVIMKEVIGDWLDKRTRGG